MLSKDELRKVRRHSRFEVVNERIAREFDEDALVGEQARFNIYIFGTPNSWNASNEKSIIAECVLVGRIQSINLQSKVVVFNEILWADELFVEILVRRLRATTGGNLLNLLNAANYLMYLSYNFGDFQLLSEKERVIYGL